MLFIQHITVQGAKLWWRHFGLRKLLFTYLVFSKFLLQITVPENATQKSLMTILFVAETYILQYYCKITKSITYFIAVFIVAAN